MLRSPLDAFEALSGDHTLTHRVYIFNSLMLSVLAQPLQAVERTLAPLRSLLRLVWHPSLDDCSFSWFRMNRELSSQKVHTLFHAADAQTTFLIQLVQLKSAAFIPHGDISLVTLLTQSHLCFVCSTVLPRISKPLLDDTE